MNRKITYLALPLLLVIAARLWAQGRSFTVRDDIEMSRFNDPWAGQQDALAKFSPDGQYFAVVTSRGLVDLDSIESTVSVFDSKSVAAFLLSQPGTRPPSGRVLKQIVSFPHREEPIAYAPVISSLRWSQDSRYIYFRGENLAGDHQLYRVQVTNGLCTRLTPDHFNVTRFDVVSGTIAYSGSKSSSTEQYDGDKENGRINLDTWDVTGRSLEEIVLSSDQSNFSPEASELRSVRVNGGSLRPNTILRSPTKDVSYLASSELDSFSLSPSGHLLVELSPSTSVPEEWELYRPARNFEEMRFHREDKRLTADDNLYRPKQYTLVMLRQTRAVPLVDAPQGTSLMYADGSHVVWSHDERYVLVTNTFLPLEGVDRAERERRLKPCVIARVELSSRSVDCIEFNADQSSVDANGSHLQTISFGTDDDEVLLRVGHSGQLDNIRRYDFRNGAWTLGGPITATTSLREVQTPSGIEENPLQVTVKQSLNEPPTLWVTDNASHRSRLLWDPNPGLAQIQLGQASVYHWRDRAGRAWTGGLIKPVGYVQGNRYPLVIQIYNFDEGQFITDGMMPTAMAARPLASAGMVVLQIQRKLPHTYNPAEGDVHLEAFESAVSSLAAEGLVNPKKVGLVGFSASCWYIENAISKLPGQFAAATIADGIDFSYLQYRLSGVRYSAIQMLLERFNGGTPLGEGLKSWMERAPSFHLETVQTPLRIEAIRPSSVLGEWEIYSSLRMQGKPVDLVYFPHGQHIHQKPLERMASQQGDVDWFRFWLEDREDSDSAKQPEYELWRNLRSLRDGIASR